MILVQNNYILNYIYKLNDDDIITRIQSDLTAFDCGFILGIG